MTNEELLDVVKMRLDGFTFADIGRMFGTTASNVKIAIQSIGGRDLEELKAGQDRTYAQIIYPRIRERMEERKWSCTRLALESGVTRQTIYRVLYGDTLRPQHNKRLAIANALDMSVEEAFREE